MARNQFAYTAALLEARGALGGVRRGVGTVKPWLAPVTGVLARRDHVEHALAAICQKTKVWRCMMWACVIEAL